jgi:hypothetical protein
VTYLRCTIGRWNIDLRSAEGREAFGLIDDEGLRVFRNQPGFIPGAQRYREWLRSSGIAEQLSLETYDGEVVVAS